MENLTEDCIFHLMEFLGLRDQIDLFRAVETHQMAIKYFWQRKYKNFTLNFFETNLSNVEFGILIEILAPTIRSISFRFFTIDKIEFLNVRNIRFPLATNLRFMQSHNAISDRNIKVLMKIFPNLRTFSPTGYLSGKYFTQWDHLEDLTLTYCRGLKMLHFTDILEKFELKRLKLDIFSERMMHLDYEKCKNFMKLEELLINSDELLWLTSQLENFNNLEEVTLTEVNNTENMKNFAKKLTETKAQDLLEIEFSFISTKLLLLPHGTYNLLQKITFINLVFPFHDNHILNSNWMRMQMPKLRELVFCECTLPVEWLLRLLRDTQFQRISVINCSIDEMNVQISYKDIKSRSKPLTLNFLNNYYTEPSERRFTEVVLQLDDAGPLFIVTTEKEKGDLSYEPAKLTFQKVQKD